MTEFQAMRDFASWQKSLKDFSWLKGAVPGASDLDLVVERRGNFLIIETKAYVPGKGVHVPFGQYLMLRAFAKETNKRVWLIGETGDEDKLYWLDLGEREPTKVRTGPVWYKTRQFQRSSKEGLSEMVKAWYAEASGN